MSQVFLNKPYLRLAVQYDVSTDMHVAMVEFGCESFAKRVEIKANDDGTVDQQDLALALVAMGKSIDPRSFEQQVIDAAAAHGVTQEMLA